MGCGCGGSVKGGERVAIRVDPDVMGTAKIVEEVYFGGVRAITPGVPGNAKHAHGDYDLGVVEGGGDGVFLGGSLVSRGVSCCQVRVERAAFNTVEVRL